MEQFQEIDALIYLYSRGFDVACDSRLWLLSSSQCFVKIAIFIVEHYNM